MCRPYVDFTAASEAVIFCCHSPISKVNILKSSKVICSRSINLLIIALFFLLPIGTSAAGEISPGLIAIPAGDFIMGSTAGEREYGYALDEQRGSDASRYYHWFENEIRRYMSVEKYYIDRYLVTNSQYQRFVLETGHMTPRVDLDTWKHYGFIHSFDETRRFQWHENGFPSERGHHPVVLVSAQDASSFCHWRGNKNSQTTRLPTEQEWEKAARGVQGNYFPWGNEFDAERLNSMDKGPYDTQEVGMYPNGVSPFGMHDAAGMVFEWTATACPNNTSASVVKGGSWDDYPGVTRPAARHCRDNKIKHILIGFRCVVESL
ncbi:MAG: formylglycine-generating enzyme family protein [Gammaproteobacteria bacterium]